MFRLFLRLAQIQRRVLELSASLILVKLCYFELFGCTVKVACQSVRTWNQLMKVVAGDSQQTLWSL